MRLLRIARLQWDVLAVCDGRGECQVIRFLEDLQGPERKAATRSRSLTLEVDHDDP